MKNSLPWQPRAMIFISSEHFLQTFTATPDIRYDIGRIQTINRLSGYV